MVLGATLTLAVSGYSQAYEGTVEYEKKQQPAILIDFSYPTDAVENALLQKMESLGYKGKEEKGLFNKDKGFRVFKGAIVPEISSSMMDYIIDIDRKSRKEKDETTLTLIMNQNGENVMAAVRGDEVAKAKEFLNNLIPDVESANLEIQITTQEDNITKIEKKLKNLRDDQEDYEKKLKNNQQDQENTVKAIETQKQALENLKAKRRTNKT